MVFLLQKWEAIELDHLICNPVGAQKVPDSFFDQKYDLGEMQSGKKKTASESRQNPP